MKNRKNRKNFSFDVGMTSLGVAVNDNDKIIHADVLLMHMESGSIKAQAERRRMFRTREAHKARENVLESLWRSIGKEPLQRKRFRKMSGKNCKRQTGIHKNQRRMSGWNESSPAREMIRSMLPVCCASCCWKENR